MNRKEYQSALVNKSVIRIQGLLDEKLLSSFYEQLNKIIEEKAGEPVVVVLNSRGGEVDIAFTLYEELVTLATLCRVTILVQTVCMSAAPFALMAVPKKQRFVFPHTSFLLHPFSFESVPAFNGTEQQHEQFTQDYRRRMQENRETMEVYIAVLAKGSGLPAKEVRKLIQENTYFVAEQAVQMGLVGEILG